MKTIFISTIVLTFILLEPAKAQYWLPSGARSSSMGRTSVAASNTWSVNNNQAGMASIKQSQAGLFFDNHYYLKELSYQACGLTLPTRYGVFGSSISNSGSSAFQTLKTGIAYARLFGFHFSAGIQLDLLYSHLSEGYGSHTTGTFEAGIQLNMTDKLKFGAHIFNPVRAHLSAFSNERIPVIFNTGLSYAYSGSLQAEAEVMKSTETPMELLTGLEYKFIGKGFIRLGMATSPLRYSFGAGFIFKQFSFDIASTYHEVLGFSPQVSIQYGLAR
jgi:hypothetical protein